MKEESDYRPTGRVLTGRMVLLMLAGFFGVMLVVNFIFATYAVKTFSGLDSDNPYDSGLAYNKEIAAARAQAELGWTVDLNRAPDGSATQVAVTVKDKAGQPVTGLDVGLHFYFPATRKLDRQVSASPVADGVYSGSAPLQSGRWDVEVTLGRNGERLFRSRNPLIVE
ncbi:FixH family protein [Rhodoblastus sp. 17X3]|jgi:nitrogen fixation protein FixH|uniref:FixH family protein n=1 Tax=Rhodoblastus sp. 17X3 TaxID=3047026 RepID=UPI0024B861B2|nr:FixH family protein [Rhodoblastus sp. 17X3]MDI9848436.1 FixH family protein [Rhodoblastus sp. 17X3]